MGAAELDLARHTAESRGTDNIDFAVADVHALDFADATYDVTHAHQVLQHVSDSVQALREMGRVTKPGGIVAVRDSDYSAFAWWPRVPELDEWMELYQAEARANGGEPDAGRRLLSWAQQAGFDDVTPGSSTWCYATPTTADDGEGCGPTASSSQRWHARWSTPAWPPAMTCTESARDGSAGRPPKTAGSHCCTARSSAAQGDSCRRPRPATPTSQGPPPKLCSRLIVPISRSRPTSRSTSSRRGLTR
ncbi:class I SAM-dependent methyltransferase [Calidifontibacter indicus]|uniref:class I SAM-dependent methyltransferase n=1 Tax=Calidifontibacter indicus TaxID=419650 RepID=UPI003CCC52F5